MKEVLRRSEGSYDLVVIDTPPLAVLADAVPLVKEVSGVIVVTRMRKTTRDASRRLHQQLQRLEAPVLGVVLNQISRFDSRYADYGAGYRQESPPPETVRKTAESLGARAVRR
jgi:Mrp family chromosome partitioning ATPase